ncbi:MAG: class I SAM-dependent methyltransferase [Gordonibacter sp.]|nr:class I SAM-dependent methyltransferase [Gordonibacter sp.]
MTIFTGDFVRENLMGPNVLLMFDELCRDSLPIEPDARICDLGCGTGLSTLAAAAYCPGRLYGIDSWNTPEQNRERFDLFDFGSRIEAIQANAPHIPFPKHYFDALFCLDSYNYFGREEGVIDALARYVKPYGCILLSFPGLVRELDDDMMHIFSASWTPEQMDYIRTINWWRKLFEKSPAVTVDKICAMQCYKQAWADWLACENEYARSDRAAIEAGALELMNMIQVKLSVRPSRE